MSESISPAMVLRARDGAYRSARPKEYTVGTTVSVFLEVFDVLTNRLAPEADIISAVAYRPAKADFPDQAIPIVPTKIQPGQWIARVLIDMPGPWILWGAVLQPYRLTTEHRFVAGSIQGGGYV